MCKVGLNITFELLTEEEQDELIRSGHACCGAYDSDSGCCPFVNIEPNKGREDVAEAD